MFSVGPNYSKLKTNLRLAINRLKLLGKRKHEMAQKMRKEIAEYILQNKEDRARIRVEHIIREDYSVEALELMESLCDLLLARFDLIQQMKVLDDGLEEAVNSILWAAPRLITEIPELRVITDQLAVKYGRQFVEACRDNRFAKVNMKLLQKLSVSTPPKSLVENYMVEIAKSHGVPFTPNKRYLLDDDLAAAEALLIDFNNQYGTNRGGPGNKGGGGGGGGSSSRAPDDTKKEFGWVLPSLAEPSAPPVLYPDVMSATVPQGPPLDFDEKHYAANKKTKEGGDVPPPPLRLDIPDNCDKVFGLPDPPAYSLIVPSTVNNGNSGGNGSVNVAPPNEGGKNVADELDFEDLSRRFDQLRKIQ